MLLAPDRPGLISRPDLEALSGEARNRPRLRLNRNFHSMEDPIHRLLNAVEPGSYIQPHRHLHPPRSETVVVVRGQLGMLLFDEKGEVEEKTVLEAGGEAVGVDLPPGVWHSYVSLKSGTVFFETKAGPYVPPPAEDLARWAPQEGEAAARGLEERWQCIFQL